PSSHTFRAGKADGLANASPICQRLNKWFISPWSCCSWFQTGLNGCQRDELGRSQAPCLGSECLATISPPVAGFLTPPAKPCMQFSLHTAFPSLLRLGFLSVAVDAQQPKIL